MGLLSFFGKKKNKDNLDKGLEKTKTSLLSRISKAIVGKSRIDEDVLDDLEEILIGSDVGVDTTIKIIDRIRSRVAKDKYTNANELDFILRDEITVMLNENSGSTQGDFYVPEAQLNGKKVPHIIMVVGVNGVGKTTTIGKLAHQLKQNGKSVMLGAADTFRAAAVDQLRIWSERVGVPIVEKGMNVPPAAVAFDAVAEGLAQDVDVVIIDTAGRLQTKINLMAELTKIKRAMGKPLEGAPHEVLLVLDASTGQNAIQQAKAFTEATEVTSLALTKLDGTAKGGVVIGICDQFKIPLKYIGVGEGIDHLQVFDAKAFVNSMFGKVEA
ncbi:MAG TPA: signal recognition particle-docking protein FtsY [Bacteroidetes bacterium]|nr:signal recognition particle-docking protein FtsY [Bacteroidota bacterium]